MELNGLVVLRPLLVALVALAGGCGTSSKKDPVDVARSAVVFDTREQACLALEARIAEGKATSLVGHLSTLEKGDLSNQLFAYETVNFTAPTECGGSTAMVVGVDSARAKVPQELDGVPLLVYHQRTINPL